MSERLASLSYYIQTRFTNKISRIVKGFSKRLFDYSRNGSRFSVVVRPGVVRREPGVAGAPPSDASDGLRSKRDTAVCCPARTGVVLPEGVLCLYTNLCVIIEKLQNHPCIKLVKLQNCASTDSFYAIPQYLTIPCLYKNTKSEANDVRLWLFQCILKTTLFTVKQKYKIKLVPMQIIKHKYIETKSETLRSLVYLLRLQLVW
jgi:hypothetical protein